MPLLFGRQGLCQNLRLNILRWNTVENGLIWKDDLDRKFGLVKYAKDLEMLWKELFELTKAPF